VARRAFHSGKKFKTKPEIEEMGYVQVKTPGKVRYVRPLTKRAHRQIVWPTEII
jgi:hypothetical protein